MIKLCTRRNQQRKPVSVKEMAFITPVPPGKPAAGPDDFTATSQTAKDKVMSVSQKFLQSRGKEDTP